MTENESLNFELRRYGDRWIAKCTAVDRTIAFDAWGVGFSRESAMDDATDRLSKLLADIYSNVL